MSSSFSTVSLIWNASKYKQKLDKNLITFQLIDFRVDTWELFGN